MYDDFFPFNKFYPEAERIVVTNPSQLGDPGFLVLWGGQDIHPELYNKPNIASYVSRSPSKRDLAEVQLAVTAIELGIPILGICRGAQLGCVLAGSILIQHVNNHCETHAITTKDNRIMLTSSLHHQMMYPNYVDHELIAWSSTRRSTQYVGLLDEEEEPKVEPEIIWFPTIKCLAIQGHPEFMEVNCLFNQYTKELIDGYIGTS